MSEISDTCDNGFVWLVMFWVLDVQILDSIPGFYGARFNNKWLGHPFIPSQLPTPPVGTTEYGGLTQRLVDKLQSDEFPDSPSTIP